MLPHEPHCLVIFIRAVVHDAEVVVYQGVKKIVVAVAVVKRTLFLPPQVGVQSPSDSLRTVAPLLFLTVSEYRRYFRKGDPSVIAVCHYIHRFIRQLCLTVRRRIAAPCVGSAEKPCASVLAGVPDAEGLKTAVAVGVTRAPQIAVESRQAVIQPVQIVHMLVYQVLQF